MVNSELYALTRAEYLHARVGTPGAYNQKSLRAQQNNAEHRHKEAVCLKSIERCRLNNAKDLIDDDMMDKENGVGERRDDVCWCAYEFDTFHVFCDPYK